MKAPCNPLSALIGDQVTYLNEYNGTTSSIVKNALWQEAPKGGRVWSYELIDGTIIPNDRVIDIIPQVKNENVGPRPSPFEELDEIDLAACMIEESQLPSAMKTAIQCIIDGDLKSLEIAQFLVGARVKQILSMEFDEAPCLAITKER